MIQSTFGPRNTWFSSLAAHQYHVCACRRSQILPIVCRSRLIFGIHDFLCINKVLYTKIHYLTHFWAQKYLCVFLSLSGHQYHVNAYKWSQIIPVITRGWLIYDLHNFIWIIKMLYTNNHYLWHFWSLKCLFLIPIVSPVSSMLYVWCQCVPFVCLNRLI